MPDDGPLTERMLMAKLTGNADRLLGCVWRSPEGFDELARSWPDLHAALVDLGKILDRPRVKPTGVWR